MKRYSLLLILGLLAGCDAVQKADGVVLDAETGLPIRGVAITRQAAEDYENQMFDYHKVYSDSLGKFEFSAISGTNKFDLYFSHEGYWTRKVKYGIGKVSDTVLLKNDSQTPKPFLLITH